MKDSNPFRKISLSGWKNQLRRVCKHDDKRNNGFKSELELQITACKKKKKKRKVKFVVHRYEIYGCNASVTTHTHIYIEYKVNNVHLY